MKIANKIVLEDFETVAGQLSSDLSKLEGQTVLITGGAGFIGNYLTLFLLHLNKTRFSKPVTVISVDNFITGSKKNLLNLKGYREFKFINHDVRKPLRFKRKIDYVIHAAGIASPVYYNKFPIEAIEVGTYGTKNLLELAKVKQVKSFVFFSTSEVYGDPPAEAIPTPETYRGNVSCTGTRSCYDESKRLGESLTMTYFRLFKCPVKIVRPFNVFGPGMTFDYRVMPSFLMYALKKKPLTVHADGKQTRTFCYIADLVVGIYKVLLSGKSGDIYNIGNDKKEINMYSLAKTIDQLFDYKLKIKRVPYPANYPADEPQRRCPDISKIRQDLAYFPQFSLVKGLKRTLEWLKSEYKL